jgi:hypothetical protein
MQELCVLTWLLKAALKTTLEQWRETWSRGPFLLAGVALILAGILCLCLSGVVFTGWWQGTLDAFGVGFTVGGLVDVLAIFALNQSLAAHDRQRQENNQRAQQILKPSEDTRRQAKDASDLLWRSKGLIDPNLASQLRDLENQKLLEVLTEFATRRLSEVRGETSGHGPGDTPQAPGAGP